MCPHCERQYDCRTDWGLVDGESVCHRCINRAPICELTQEHTFQPMSEVINNSGTMVFAKSDGLGVLFKACDDDGKYYTSTVKAPDGYTYNTELFDEYYDTCDECDDVHEVDDLIEHVGLMVCSVCKEDLNNNDTTN